MALWTSRRIGSVRPEIMALVMALQTECVELCVDWYGLRFAVNPVSPPTMLQAASVTVGLRPPPVSITAMVSPDSTLVALRVRLGLNTGTVSFLRGKWNVTDFSRWVGG